MRSRTPQRWSRVVDVDPEYVEQYLTPDRHAWAVAIRYGVLTARPRLSEPAPLVVPLDDVRRTRVVDLPGGRWAAELERRDGAVTQLAVRAEIVAARITERIRLLR